MQRPRSKDLPLCVLNASRAASIVVGIIIGSGIFLVAREMMAAVGSSARSLYQAESGSWAACSHCLGAMDLWGDRFGFIRDMVGEYTFPSRGLWRSLGLPVYVDADHGLQACFAGDDRCRTRTPVLWEPSQSSASFCADLAFAHLSWGQVFAIAVTWLIAGLNIIGTRKSANVQLLLTWLKGLLILVIAGFCFGAAGQHGTWHNFATEFAGARGGFSGFMIALIAALWAYDGWSDVVTMAGEIERPQRSMPIALRFGGVGRSSARFTC